MKWVSSGEDSDDRQELFYDKTWGARMEVRDHAGALARWE